MLGIKQEALAVELGNDWNQRKIFLLEPKEVIEEELLERVAKVLKVPEEAIKLIDEETAINIIGNTITNHGNSSVLNFYPTFNPIEKIIELYEALITSEKEKVQIELDIL
jgi:hypothetical protein